MSVDQFKKLDTALFQQTPVIQQLELSSLLLNRLAPFWPELQLANNAQPLSVNMLRLDYCHPFISGNKWPKMRAWIQQQLASGSHTLTTMGGAHSNHLVAFAAACQQLQVNAICYVRANGQGEELLETPTLHLLKQFKAEIKPVSRTAFRALREQVAENSFLPEGGKSEEAMKSICEWVSLHRSALEPYNSIYTACGTGTWFAGLVAGLSFEKLNVNAIGVPAVAGQKWLANDIQALLAFSKALSDNWALDWSFPVKGFTPLAPELVKTLGATLDVSLDPVYLPRVLYAVIKAWQEGRFAQTPLIIHSGGVQASGRYIAKRDKQHYRDTYFQQSFT